MCQGKTEYFGSAFTQESNAGKLPDVIHTANEDNGDMFNSVHITGKNIKTHNFQSNNAAGKDNIVGRILLENDDYLSDY
jgi:hypothetical protein